ncbi:MAG TPA: hypothetical protein VK658_08850 [Chryseolinea sp.]|nr:hypothetical protein [Chryseolinea sp.]
MQQIYRYNLSKLVKRLTPPRWRNPTNLNWYETLLSGINYSQDRFNAFKDQALVELSYNGQTIYMEKMLNDRYDPSLRRIIIQHEQNNSAYWYVEGEGQAPVYLYTEPETGATQSFLYIEGENSTGLPDGIDFVVKAPVSLTSQEVRMKADVNKYKLAGKQFEIIFS